ncbi:lasso peptide biosynthesis B2 protein [Sphingosinicella terrae]|uniref:lasso peptide biosynthesis B2 protein n=1 Tax=Sphingosinicella terrae TaxID=2172047 RepID=UPI000E0D9DCF|nr:lasso peptide biosynthesis B2 protein [Sphingosinicella terrae]
MTVTLREGLSYGFCCGRVVFLDISTDRYFCLAGEWRDLFLRLSRGENLQERQAELGRLADLGLVRIASTASPFPEPATIAPPGLDLADAAATRPSLRDLAAALAAEVVTILELRLRRIHLILERIERRDAAAPAEASDDRYRQIACAFERTSLIFPAADRCLVRAFALMRLCRWRGLRPKLVFGVRLDPFTAHCWVQSGHAVLVGGFEQARQFAPVRVVE